MSSELKMDTSFQIIKINSRNLVFKINQKTLSEKLKTEKEKNNSNKYILISECFIKIENISTNYVALRERTAKNIVIVWNRLIVSLLLILLKKLKYYII